MADVQTTLREWFEHASAIDTSVRDRFLDDNVPDAGLRRQLRAMLAADAAAGALLDVPAAEVVRRLQQRDEDLEALIGARVGSFRITGLLGEGGSSVVFDAERASGDGTQRVALKLLRDGLHSTAARERFRREQAILAQLSHPNVARLVEAGLSETGIPFIAMDRIEGEPITRHADRRRLGLRERLELILPACRATDAAHRALVVHRDLKPANVLVDECGEVKLVDFGIARLLDAGGGDASEEAGLTLTPAYAPPEQHRGGPVTTAADVYALGVILSELLCGERLDADTTDLPSRRVAIGTRPLPNGLPDRAKLARALRGDLDAILARTLSADPAQRYASPGLLADDIQRFLDGQPVDARGGGNAYRAQRFVVRHRFGVAVVAIALAALLASLASSLWHAARTREALARSRTVQTFLVDLFEASEPGAALETMPDARTLLARGTERARNELGAEPELKAALLGVIARAHRRLGLYAESEQLAIESRALNLALHGEGYADTIDDTINLGLVRYELGRYDESLEMLREGERIAREQGDAVRLAEALDGIGNTLAQMARAPEAIRVQEEALRLRERTSGIDGIDTEFSLSNLAGSYMVADRLDEAAVLLGRVLALRERRLGRVHASVATALSNLAEVERRRGHCDLAVDALRRAIHIDEAVYATANPRWLAHIGNLGVAQHGCGDFVGAEVTLRRAAELQESVNGSSHPLGARARMNHAAVLLDLGLYGDARVALTPVIDVLRTGLGADHPLFATALTHRGECALRLGDAATAREDLGTALAVQEKTDGQAANAARTAALLGLVRRLTAGQASERSVEAHAWLERAASAPPASVLRARLAIVELDLALGDGAAALAGATTAVAVARTLPGDSHPRLVAALELQARAATMSGDVPLATRARTEARGLAGNLPPGHPLRTALDLR